MNDLSLLGPLCAFLSSCTWALGSSTYSKLSRNYTPFQVNFSRALFAFPCFVIAVFALHGGWSGGIAAYQTLTERHFTLLGMSVVSSYALGDVLFLWSTISLGVPGALAIASSFPILTALYGLVTGGEALHAVQWLGLLIAIGAIVAVILSDPQRAKGAPNTQKEVRAWMKKKSFGILLAVATAGCWAVNSYTSGRAGLDLHPTVGNTLRMGYALILISLLGPLIEKKITRPVSAPDLKKYSWLFILESFGGSYLFLYGLSHTSIVLGSVLASLAPVLSVPVAIALKLEKFSWARTLSVFTVVVGLALLAGS